MSELHANRAAAPLGRAYGVREPAPAYARVQAGPAGAAALADAREALYTAPVSREALRASIVRYAAAAREHGAAATEVTGALEAVLGPALATFPAPVAAELRVHVAWWAAHGYHRAD